MNRKHLLLFLMIILTDVSYAYCATIDHYYFSTIDRRAGLPNNSVSDILQDRTGFLWFATKEGLTRYDGKHMRVFNKTNSGLKNDYAITLFEAKDKKLWIGTDEGLFIYDEQTERITRFLSKIANTVMRIKTFGDGLIWFSVDYEGLFCYNPTTHQLRNFYVLGGSARIKKSPESPNVCHFWKEGHTLWVALYDDNLYAIPYPSLHSRRNPPITRHPFRDDKGDMPFYKTKVFANVRIGNLEYIGCSKGLYAIDMRTHHVQRLIDCFVHTLCFDGSMIWTGSESGIYVYNIATKKITPYTESSTNDPFSISSNAVYAIYRDRENSIWIGSYFGGINYCNRWQFQFEKIYKEAYPIFGRRVREFCEDPQGRIWVGTEDQGLYIYDKRDQTIQRFTNPLIHSNVHGLCCDGKTLWVGTYNGGLNRINLSTGGVTHWKRGSSEIISDNVEAICRLRSGEIWLGTDLGLMRYEPTKNTFIKIPEFPQINICHILEDSKGRLWLATYTHGLYVYNRATRSWKNYYNTPGDDHSLQTNKVLSTFEDSKHRIWVATQGGGLALYLPRTENFRRYDVRKGMPSNTIYQIEEDANHYLWLSTSNGLVKFNPTTEHIERFTTNEGLIYDQFNYRSGYKDREGWLYFGSINGFVTFDPNRKQAAAAKPVIYLTELDVLGKLMTVESEDTPLKKSIMLTDAISLRPEQNSIDLRASVISFNTQNRYRLEYRLEGLSDIWSEIGSDQLINFSHLPYGTYTLHVRDKNGNCQGERTLQITVRPPFLLSVWAKLFYLLLFFAAIGYAARFLIRRNREKQRRMIEKIESEKEKALYHAKIDFFTNVTHEIRTPLTLVKAPLESVLERNDVKGDTLNELKIMDLNVKRLLDLVNQLLDFRKADTRGFTLKIKECRIDEVLHHVFQLFAPFAEQRQLKYIDNIRQELSASVDEETLTKIASNLLSNAIKFAATFVEVEFTVESDCFCLRVSNDGERIPERVRTEIFKPFVQYKYDRKKIIPGSGIGLPLARTLVELHDGTLEVDDTADCNCFVVRIPIRHAIEAAGKSDVIEEQDAEAAESPQEKKPYTILVVEDDDEIRNYVCKKMKDRYQIVAARDGEEALHILEQQAVSLIVTDIMMPHVDGLQLTESVRTDVRFSHIPIVLLTAKDSLQTNIEGLEKGADAYIAKPFSMKLLKTTVANLLTSRAKLRAAFMSSPDETMDTLDMTEADTQFLSSLNDIIEGKLLDSSFNLEQLSSELGMSQSSLNRKIKGLLDTTPNDYIRLVRMKKAAQLIKSKAYRVNEVCYRVGFTSPSYFTTCFKKQFGVLPSEYSEGQKGSEPPV
jgi:ligand-binding sensor domain-containing protein/signal transduction histidine kinase/CheY-like chemotaxis protein/AraC-like DNA-binding protein